LSAKIESASVPVPPQVQELVLLETLKALRTATIRSLSQAEPANLVEVSRRISDTADDVMAAAPNLSRVPLTGETQQQRQKLLAELRQQTLFCRAMLRRWRRSIHLRRQLLDLATEPVIYTDSLDPNWGCHE
jgi:non-ribosomal peptide synthetase component F